MCSSCSGRRRRGRGRRRPARPLDPAAPGAGGPARRPAGVEGGGPKSETTNSPRTWEFQPVKSRVCPSQNRGSQDSQGRELAVHRRRSREGEGLLVLRFGFSLSGASLKFARSVSYVTSAVCRNESPDGHRHARDERQARRVSDSSETGNMHMYICRERDIVI